MASPHIDVVCALIEDGFGRVLVARRPAGKHLAGLWEFPGGKVESGESMESALHRELAEELGCQVDLICPLTPVSQAYAEVTVRLYPWRAALRNGSPEPLAREHEEQRWVDAAQLAALAMPEADVPIVREWCELRRQIFG